MRMRSPGYFLPHRAFQRLRQTIPGIPDLFDQLLFSGLPILVYNRHLHVCPKQDGVQAHQTDERGHVHLPRLGDAKAALLVAIDRLDDLALRRCWNERDWLPFDRADLVKPARQSPDWIVWL